MLDKNLHQNQLKSFVLETLNKIAEVNGLPQSETNLENCANELIVWMAPNHKLIDLSPIEKDDLLVIGSQTDLEIFEKKHNPVEYTGVWNPPNIQT